MQSTRFYNANAERLSKQYEALSPEDVHHGWAGKYLPQSPGFACDIGAGSGRDANWLAAMGWDVIAVEPSAEMRQRAQQKAHPRVTWLDDSLPGLERLRSLGHRFDLVLLSAVWMHLPPGARKRSFRVISELLKPGGRLIITLRHGTDEAENKERGFYPVSADELLSFANERALAITDQQTQPDQARAHVNWETLVFTMPDDGTGSLPLLRHIIVNDDKASSYKLGLLRVLTRIAEGAPGVVLRRTDEFVEIPLGLVGLYWLKQYKPLLLQHKIPQHPNRRQGYGFAGEDFNKLEKVSPYDLRVGMRFSPDLAPVITGAIRDACKNIVAMPVKYIRYPGQNRPIFTGERSGVRKMSKPITLSLDYLTYFGVFRIPTLLWETMGHYACWLEPAILREWSGLSKNWGVADYKAVDSNVFDWEEGRRDTSVAISRINAMQAGGEKVSCVWSASRPRLLHVDHCLPWSRWMNNDLWNLMPASAMVNIQKGDRLPSAIAMADAKQRITEWWHRAYFDSPLQERFLMEAEVSLPRLTSGTPDPADMYHALLHQRARLKEDQQIAEWSLG